MPFNNLLKAIKYINEILLLFFFNWERKNIISFNKEEPN